MAGPNFRDVLLPAHNAKHQQPGDDRQNQETNAAPAHGNVLAGMAAGRAAGGRMTRRYWDGKAELGPTKSVSIL
jgi:hypothetical protein